MARLRRDAAQARHIDHIPFGQPDIQAVDGFVSGAQNRAIRESGLDACDATDMIVMLVRDQYRRDPLTRLLHVRQYRVRIARVDYGNLLFAFVDYPDVVIVEGIDTMDLDHAQPGGQPMARPASM